jgi:hypothetical protein
MYTALALSAFVIHMYLYWGAVMIFDTDRKSKTKFVWDVIWNQCVLVFPTLLLQEILLFAPRRTPMWPSAAPLTEGVAAVLGTLLGDVLFYTLHKHMHNPSNPLHHLHNQHHKPLRSAAQALDSSPCEVLLLNLLMPFVGYHILGCCRLTVYGAQALGTVYSVATHSTKMRTPFTQAPHWHHELHHQDSRCNYSIFGWSDILMGTFRDPTAQAT